MSIIVYDLQKKEERKTIEVIHSKRLEQLQGNGVQ